MKIRAAVDPEEYTVSRDDGETVRCPVCQARWSHEQEGETSQEECPHLKFFFFNDDFVDFFNDGDKDDVSGQYRRLHDRLEYDDEHIDVIDILKQVKSAGIDEAIFVVFSSDPSAPSLGVWGYQK
jgi:hypothetical protein